MIGLLRSVRVNGVEPAPGFIHVDIKYLPQMADETQRRYLFVAIDRATRWVYVHIYSDPSEKSSTHFLRRLHAASPMKIEHLLTDHGIPFTARFPAQGTATSGTRPLLRPSLHPCLRPARWGGWAGCRADPSPCRSGTGPPPVRLRAAPSGRS